MQNEAKLSREIHWSRGGGGIADIVVSEVDLLVINISKTKAKPGFTVKTLLYIWAVIFRATCLTMTL